ncbi:Uncharacterised protein [Enterobacter hormaechei]|nr:Uncharacterised protein [Enterobacter hormaechei]
MMPAWNQVILMTKVVVMTLALQRLVMAFAMTPMTPMVMALAPLAMAMVIVMTAKTPMPVMGSPKEKAKRKMTPPITQTAKVKKMRMPRKRLKTVNQALFLLRMK